MTLAAFDEATGLEVHVGDTITNFRGESTTLRLLTRPRGEAWTGRVVVERDGWPHGIEHYDRVYGLIVREV